MTEQLILTFISGGIICVIAQLLIDFTRLTPARILVLYVSAGVLIFAVGITLFFGCDFCIMLRMLLPPQGLIYDVIRFMVWVFYIPSQAVLTSSYLADKANQ